MKSHLTEYKSKTALVTGGAGAIGSNLTLGLLNAGVNKIIILDDLSSGVRWNVPDSSSVVFVQGSILNEETLRRVFSDRPDFVFHLAAHFANQNSVDNPETDLEINGLGTLRLLEYARMARVPRFVFASSGCSVYGSEAPLPLTEDFVTINLDTPYQITKLLGELYCNFYWNFYKLPVVRARFFNSYGPGEVPGRYRNVIPNFNYWANHKKPLPITGTGEETRDFTYVGDIVDGLLRMGTIPAAVGDAFNLASETETRVIDLANMINKICDNSAGIEYIPRRDWDKITRRRASVAKAHKILGYDPKTKMDVGLQKVFGWFSQNRDKIEASAKF